MEWATTTPSGRAHTCEADDGNTGWRLHLIEPGSRVIYSNLRGGEIDVSPALCGLSAKHGWGLDLFVNTPCKRCLTKGSALGIIVPEIPE